MEAYITKAYNDIDRLVDETIEELEEFAARNHLEKEWVRETF